MEGEKGGNPGEKRTGGAREAEVGGEAGFLRWREVGEIVQYLAIEKGASHESDVSAFSRVLGLF